jgi:hypothetical protein
VWVQASLDDKQRLQLLSFPDGIAYDGNRFNRTTVTAPPPFFCRLMRMVTQTFTSWNPLTSWLRQVERLRHAA